jgi:DNA-binding HxlR family transcriptional regulator
MRTYGQYCALARSLDVVGDRWTLLIVRELFARDSRYSDLRDSLPGIATNLLAERLRRLEDEEIIESYAAPPPVRATVYRLTERGKALGPVLRALVQWGLPLLEIDRGDDAFRPQWMMLATRIIYDGISVDGLAPLTLVIRAGQEPVTVVIGPDGVETSLGDPGSETAVEIEGDPEAVYSLLVGTREMEARVSITGPEDALARFRGLVERAGARPAAVDGRV